MAESTKGKGIPFPGTIGRLWAKIYRLDRNIESCFEPSSFLEIVPVP